MIISVLTKSLEVLRYLDGSCRPKQSMGTVWHTANFLYWLLCLGQEGEQQQQSGHWAKSNIENVRLSKRLILQKNGPNQDVWVSAMFLLEFHHEYQLECSKFWLTESEYAPFGLSTSAKSLAIHYCPVSMILNKIVLPFMSYWRLTAITMAQPPRLIQWFQSGPILPRKTGRLHLWPGPWWEQTSHIEYCSYLQQVMQGWPAQTQSLFQCSLHST